MITYLNYNTESYYVGLSSDDKPTNVQNGSLFHEIDTSQDFRFDEVNKEWIQQNSNRWWMNRYD